MPGRNDAAIGNGRLSFLVRCGAVRKSPLSPRHSTLHGPGNYDLSTLARWAGRRKEQQDFGSGDANGGQRQLADVQPRRP